MSEVSTAAALSGDNGAAAAASTAPAAATAPTAAPAAAPASAPATAAPATAAPSTWYDGADELTTGYIQNKGWQSPLEAIKSYQNLEQLLGADRAGRTVVMPKADATPEEKAAFYEKLGRPSEASGYQIPVPEKFGDKEFAGQAGAWFHELGLTKAQGEALASKWNEYVGGRMQSFEVAQQQNFQQDDMKLKQEWGAAHAQNLAAAQTAARGLNLNAETIDKLQSALGHYGTMNLLAKIGSKAMESSFVSGEENQGFGNAMTPAQAKAEIKALQNDREFTKQYIGGNAEARAKMDRLMKFAYPE